MYDGKHSYTFVIRPIYDPAHYDGTSRISTLKYIRAHIIINYDSSGPVIGPHNSAGFDSFNPYHYLECIE